MICEGRVRGENNLTNPEIISILLERTETERGTDMKGTIRVKGKCSECEGPFEQVKKLGFICPSCKITPKKFYVDLFHKGQRIRIFSDKTGQILDSYQRALTLLSRINSELQDYTFDPTKYVKAELERFYTQALLDRFLNDKLPLISPSRKNHYRRYTELAKEFFKTTDVRDIRKIHVSDFKKDLIEKYYGEQPKQGKTLKNVLDHFKTFLIYCMKEYEMIDKVPSFPGIELQPYQFRWLGQEDQINLYNLVEDKHKPLIAFLMLHGCRPGEARALKCRDIDIKRQTITITATFSDEVYKERRKGRGAKSVTIPIHSEMIDYISERIRNNHPEAFVFTNRNGHHYTKDDIYRLWERVRINAKIGKDLRLYDVTRHSFASQLVNSNTSIFKVSRLLGHSSVKMTEKYSHHDIEKLKTDIQKLSLKKTATVTRLSPKAKSK